MRAVHHQVLDARTIQTLIEHTGAGVAERFLNDYLDLLPARAARIVAALAARDEESTLDALVSLRVASAMAGAREMEETSSALEQHVQAGQWPNATTVKAELSRSILRLVSEARDQGHLSRKRPEPRPLKDGAGHG